MFEHESIISNPEFRREYPLIFKGLGDMNDATKTLFKDGALTEIIKIRASQINGCAYCVGVHVKIGLQAGLTQEKIDQVAVWRDSHHFDMREKIALALCEDLTRIHTNFPNQETMNAAKQYFTQNEIILLVAAIANINAWNRLGVGLGF